MTYRELRDKLNNYHSDIGLDRDVSVLLMSTDEVHRMIDLVLRWDDFKGSDAEAVGLHQVVGILDYDHPFFTADA